MLGRSWSDLQSQATKLKFIQSRENGLPSDSIAPEVSDMTKYLSATW